MKFTLIKTVGKAKASPTPKAARESIMRPGRNDCTKISDGLLAGPISVPSAEQTCRVEELGSIHRWRPNTKLEPAFRSANEHWTGLQEDFNNPRSPLFQALQEPDPNKIPQKFSAKGQIGGSPFNAEVLDKYGIDKGPLKRMVLQDMLNQDFRIRGKTLAGYSDDFLKSLYTPEELESVYKTGAIARSVGMNTNPSGTAAVEGAMQDVQKPIRSAIPKTWSANRTMSPSFNQRLMRCTPGPVAGTIANMMRGTQPVVAACLSLPSSSDHRRPR